MSLETVSFVVRCWYDTQTSTTQLQVVEVDQGEEVHLANSSFLVRVSIDEEKVMERCHIRHITSGREAYVQGGPGLSAFVEECLLDSAALEPMYPDPTAR